MAGKKRSLQQSNAAPTEAPQLVLAIDLGTSSTKAALFDLKGNRFLETTAQRSYPLVADADGRAEIEPQVLAAAFDGCIRHAIEAARTVWPGGFKITAVGISCFWHSMLALDAAGAPITNVITWADARCREDAAKLRQALNERLVHQRTGCMLRASFWPAKLAWFQRTRPRQFRAVRRWVSPAEWLAERWCGSTYCAPGMATGTGLYNPALLRWDGALLKRFDLTEGNFNPLGEQPSQSGAIDFPELHGAKWFPAIGDGAASNLGSGAVRPGLAALNVGTSAALRVMNHGEGKAVRAPFGLFCYRVDEERFLVGGAVSNAGNLRAWCLRELRLADDAAEIEEALAGRRLPEHGLTVLPFWVAERAPYWREEMRGAVLGLNQTTSALDLLQATTEGVYFRLALIASKIRGAEGSQPKIIVSGGVQKSPSSLLRLANILGQPVYPSDEPEASLRGAAVFALEKLGERPGPAETGAPVRPDRKVAVRYRAEFERHKRLEELLGRDES